jgi:hypothetical protein
MAPASNSQNPTHYVKTQPHLTRHELQVTPKRATQLTDRDQTIDHFMFFCRFPNIILWYHEHILSVQVVAFIGGRCVFHFGGKFKKAEKFFLISFCSNALFIYMFIYWNVI